MAKDMEKKLREILAALYQASGHKDDCDALASNAVQYMLGETTELHHDIAVRAVKGGTYKIKDYYLENNELTDIRGASAIITEVQEKIVPALLQETVGFDSIIYNGGGNMLALIPASAPADIGDTLEHAAERCLLTANVAYICTEPFPLSELLSTGYNHCIAGIESELNERKKSRSVCDYQPVSEMNGEKLCEVLLRLPEAQNSGDYCERCCKRLASYSLGSKKMCGGCAHKYLVGSEYKERFADDYRQYLRQEQFDFAETVLSPKEYKDIDKDNIAVVYADGNNMGGLIQNFTNITDMMDFSDFVKKTMTMLVYRAMAACSVQCFEIAAVGGDDIFILLPAKKSISFSQKLIGFYKQAFDAHFAGNHSTLSVGICIAKPKDKIKVMLEAAEEELRRAKHLMKQDDYANASGSLSFVVMDSYEGVSTTHGTRSMLPYSYEQLLPVLEFADHMRENNLSSRIRNIAEAYTNAESAAEMALFFRYINAKEKDDGKRIRMPEIPGYMRRDGFYEDKNGNTVSFWEDIIDLMNFHKNTERGR